MPFLFHLSLKYVRIPFATAAAAFIFGFLAHIWAKYSGFLHADTIIAGCVMRFVPGIATTNAVRDRLNNHTQLPGMSKLFETTPYHLHLNCPELRSP